MKTNKRKRLKVKQPQIFIQAGYLPTRVSSFDKMIDTGGIERGLHFLLAGGAGLESPYSLCNVPITAALNGEKVVILH